MVHHAQRRHAVFLSWCLIAVTLLALGAEAPLPTLNEDHVSVIGWTEAHDAVYGWPVQGKTIPRDQVKVLLKDASSEFLCRRNDFGQTALHLAVRQELLGVVSIYVDRNICIDTPNNDGDTALHYAAVWDRVEAAQLLLSVADSQIQNNKGESALDDARSNGHEAIAALIESASEKEL